VTIRRARHPQNGKTFKVVRWSTRGGVLHYVLELPDGSNLFVPAVWTDHSAACKDQPTRIEENSCTKSTCIASVTDLLRTRKVVDSLFARQVCLDHEPDDQTVKEASENATAVSGIERCTTGSAQPDRSARTVRTNQRPGESDSEDNRSKRTRKRRS